MNITVTLMRALYAAPVIFCVANVQPAQAIDLRCIEESKYKHLYQLFGGDARKLAIYLNISADRMPDPEACRAVLLSGGIGGPNDREKFLDFVVRNKGWLAVVHLNSGGGNVWTGQQLGYIVRAFRLKTVTARSAGNKILYAPDFVLPTASTEVAIAPAPAATSGPAQPSPPRCLLQEHPPASLVAKNAISGLSRPEPFQPTYDANTSRPGGDYRQFDVALDDPKLCQKACLDDAKCGAWDYRKPDNGLGHCWLKDRVLARVSDKNTVSGRARENIPDATYEENTVRGGSDYREFDLPKADARLCQKACFDEARCRAWAYRKPEGRTNNQPHCWLKERAPPITSDRLMIGGLVERLQYLQPTLEQNVVRQSSDYREFDLANADPTLCQNACLDETRCRAWAYRKPEGRTNNRAHCWLKDHIPAEMVEDGLMASGMVIRANNFEPTFEKVIDRPGPDYRRLDFVLPEPRACQKACGDDGKCRSWVYQEPNRAYLVSLAGGWDAYRARQRSISQAPPSSDWQGNDWCASSCVQIHVAGLDRSGVMQVHRPNQGFGRVTDADNLTLSDADMPQFYKYMDAGPRVTKVMQATSATTVTPVFASRFPRYVLDYLIVHCNVDPEQLQGLETQLETTIKDMNPAAADVSLKLDPLRSALVKLHERRRRAEQCVAQALEQDRLAAYDKLCGRSCDQKKLGADFDEAVRKIHVEAR